ncbi:MAG: MarR family winged helix-turn-helix transcriptional regulator [Arenibacterium sp.]
MKVTRLSPAALKAASGGCFCFAARKRARILTRLYDATLSEHGLTSGQFSMLAALAGAGPLTVQRLADVMELDHSATSRGIAPLLRAGLLGQVKDASDGRKRVLNLTEAGTAKLNTAALAWDALQHKIESDAQFIETAMKTTR